MSRRLRMDVFFDFICPWCLIGKRQLEPAQVQFRSGHPDASAAGLAIDLSRIATMANAADVHRLFKRVSELGNATQREILLERLFAAYFRNGENLGCRERLLAIAHSCGVDSDIVADCLEGNARPCGGFPGAASGVPRFQFERRMTVIGAQPAKALLGAMNEALEEIECEQQPA